MLSRQLLLPIPHRPQQELEELRLDEGEPPREAAVEPEPERQEEYRVVPRHIGFKPQGGTCSCTLTASERILHVHLRQKQYKGTTQAGSLLHGTWC